MAELTAITQLVKSDPEAGVMGSVEKRSRQGRRLITAWSQITYKVFNKLIAPTWYMHALPEIAQQRPLDNVLLDK